MTSLVTRCPACSTLFKVVPDQLRISEGWVRCGQCDEVFDAQAHMQPHIMVEPDAGPSPGPVSPPAPEVDFAAQTPAQADEVSVAEAPALDAVPDAAQDAAEAVSAPPPPVDEATEDEALPDLPEPAPAEVVEAGHPDELLAEPDAAPEPIMAVGPSGHEAVAAALRRFEQNPQTPETLEAQDFQASFLKRPAQQVVSGRKRWLQKTLVLLLSVLLLLQVVVQQRDRIAATEPALATALQFLCQGLGCQVVPLRQIESIVIESSSFIKVKADVYRLSFSLKNTALVPLALPFAELALTDLRDQSVLRRVLAPSEYGARADTLGPGDELTLVVPVAVRAVGPASDKVTGYRLLVFYP